MEAIKGGTLTEAGTADNNNTGAVTEVDMEDSLLLSRDKEGPGDLGPMTGRYSWGT